MKLEKLGYVFIDYGFTSCIGERYKVDIDSETANSLVKFAPIKDLERMLETQIEFENYEWAAVIKKEIDNRINKAL